LALYDTITGWNHFALVPVMTVLGGFMLGIEELSCQLEEPFSILPMAKMCEHSIRDPVMDQVEQSIQMMTTPSEAVDSGVDNITSVNGSNRNEVKASATTPFPSQSTVDNKTINYSI
jgi:hypothetical protein